MLKYSLFAGDTNQVSCNGTWIYNHLVRKRTLNHLAKLAKCLSCVVSTYQHFASDCMFLSCHVRVSEWIHTHELSGCGFKSRCNHLNFRFRAWFEQGVSWHSGNYRVWIHPETRTWHDKNIQSSFLHKIKMSKQQRFTI